MHKKILLLAIHFLFGLMATACTAAYTPELKIPESQIKASEDPFGPLDYWLQSLNEANRFNGSVLIANADRILFTGSYGYNDAQGSQELDENSSFNLASVSKQFTGFAILLLHNEGTLSVYDLVKDHIPELDIYSSITIEHLLHHTSGLPDYISLAIESDAEFDIFDNTDLIELFEQIQPELIFKPGEEFEYSNTGYVLLSEIVSRAAEQPYEEFMQSQIFDAIGMKNSQAFNLLSESPPENRVFGYKRDLLNPENTVENDLNDFDGVTGDGGIYASAYDLFLWHQALLTEKLMAHSEYDQAITTGRLDDGTDTHYGYGLTLSNNAITSHSGAWVGFSSYFLRDPSSGLLLVVLDNSTNADRVGSTGSGKLSINENIIRYLQAL